MLHAIAPQAASIPKADEPEATTAAAPTATEDKSAEARSGPRHEQALLAEHGLALDQARFEVGEGLVFVSKNGRFKLATRLRAQFLYRLVHDEDDGLTHAFEIRRARLQFTGHLFSEDIEFKTELAISPRDIGLDEVRQNTPILDWYVQFGQLRDLTVRVGQYKVPFSRQRVISSGDLQLVDRALAQGEFNLDRDVGLDLRSDDIAGLGRLRYYAGVYLGEGRDPFEPSGFGLMYLARFEVLPMGDFADYAEADFARTRKPRLSLGAAYAFIDDAARNRGILGSAFSDQGTADFHNVTADFMFKIVGFSALGEFFYRYGTRDYGEAVIVDDAGAEVLAPHEPARSGLGWFLQAGYLLPRLPLEFAARYSQVHALGSPTSLTDTDEVGGGINYYFARHPFKLQLDYAYRWQQDMVRQGAHQVRLQLQLGF